MWIEEPKRGDLLTKAFPSFEDGNMFLQCRKCQHPYLIYGSISSGWNIGPLKRHLKSSTECTVTDVVFPEASVTMDMSDNVSMTPNFLTLFMSS
jgi:hypothetical protein